MRAREERQLKIRDYILMGGVDDNFLRAVGEGHHLHRDVVRAVRGNGRRSSFRRRRSRWKSCVRSYRLKRQLLRPELACCRTLQRREWFPRPQEWTELLRARFERRRKVSRAIKGPGAHARQSLLLLCSSVIRPRDTIRGPAWIIAGGGWRHCKILSLETAVLAAKAARVLDSARIPWEERPQKPIRLRIILT